MITPESVVFMGTERGAAIGILSLMFIGYLIIPGLVDGFSGDHWIDREGFVFTGVECEQGNLFTCEYEVTESKEMATGEIVEGENVILILLEETYFAEYYEDYNSYLDDISQLAFNFSINALYYEYGSAGEWNVTFPNNEHYIFVRINPSSTHNVHLVYDWNVLTEGTIAEDDLLLMTSLVVVGIIVVIGIIVCKKQS